jgi:8-oxo-dGTP diphosphatase
MRPVRPDLDSRRYPTAPRVGVGVAILNDQRLLMVRRGQEPKQGSWSLPGGLVELGEPVRAAARREVREECGIDVEVTELLDVVDFVQRDESGRVVFHYVLVDFRGNAVTMDVQPGDDVEAVQWIPLHELACYEMPEVTRAFLDRHFLKASS